MARRRFSYPLSLAVVVAVLIALTGGWIAWWNYRSGVRNVRDLAATMFDQISREAANETSAFLLRAPPAAEALVGIGAWDDASVNDVKRIKRYESVLRANPSFTWVSYADKAGAFIGVYRPATGGLRANLSRIAAGITTRDEYTIADDSTWSDKQTVADTKYDPRTRPFYTLASASPTGVWTPPYVFEGQNVPGITFAIAHRNGGQVEGVYTIDFDLARLSELTRQLEVSEHGKVVLMSSDDVVLAHPSASVVRPAAPGKPPELVHLAELDDPAVRALRAAGANATAFELDGERYVARTLAITIPGGPAWQVLAYAPESDFTSGVRGRMLFSLLISLIAVVLAVAVAWLLARRVSGPLTALAGEMAKAGKLHLEDVEDHSSIFKEIDMMNTALVQMKGGLRSFARYVPRDLVRTLVESGLDAELTGELRTLTIFFSDLEGFTSLAETRRPDDLVKFLGKYFDDISRIIAAERGTIDKYMGDGIMAFWGAPTKVEDHAA
ncbi:MAG: cache domain-containing protein, partial [Polyangiales bacterium]